MNEFLNYYCIFGFIYLFVYLLKLLVRMHWGLATSHSSKTIIVRTLSFLLLLSTHINNNVNININIIINIIINMITIIIIIIE